MAERRYDMKGRVLRSGETQRKKDGVYEYRYITADNKRKSIYSKDLNKLREKEKEIERALSDGVDYNASNITVYQLVDHYISIKDNSVRDGTKKHYREAKNRLSIDGFGTKKINRISISDAKRFIISLHQAGYAYGTIKIQHAFLKAAFRHAVRDSILRTNAFDFKLSECIKNETKERVALTAEDQERLLSFIKHDACYKKHYDLVITLLWTGLRVSELCGLTIDNIDFDNRKITVDHQLLWLKSKGMYIEDLKTSNGHRCIPMSPEVYASIQRVIASRTPADDLYSVDGYSRFVFTTKSGKPRHARDVTAILYRIQNKYNSIHPDYPLPKISPHTFRHTFCTNMVNAGIGVKQLQKILGHASLEMTLGLYTHMTYESIRDEFFRVVDPGNHEGDLK